MGLNDKLWADTNKNTKNINDISDFKRLSVETDDYDRILRAIESTAVGGCLRFNADTYDLGGNDIVLDKSIKLFGYGYNATIISNGGLSIESSDVELSNLFISCPDLDNAIQINQTAVSNIKIDTCKLKGRDHGCLIESYYGTVSDVTVINCETNDSIHGFISKATNVKFINCKAYNHSGFGFAFISDNIPGNSNIANCKQSIILNCIADTCGTGFYTYCRDKYTTPCVPRCANNSVDGFVISNCASPFAVGEESIPATYAAIYQIDYLTINNIKVVNPTQSVWAMSLRNCYKAVVDNCILPYTLEQKATATECLIGNVIITSIKPHTKNISLLSTGSSGTIDTSLNTAFEIIVNNNPTDTLLLSNKPKNGNIITVMVRATGTTTYAGFNTSNLHLGGRTILTSFGFNHGQILQFLWSVGLSKWVCIDATGDINFS